MNDDKCFNFGLKLREKIATYYQILYRNSLENLHLLFNQLMQLLTIYMHTFLRNYHNNQSFSFSLIKSITFSFICSSIIVRSFVISHFFIIILKSFKSRMLEYFRSLILCLLFMSFHQQDEKSILMLIVIFNFRALLLFIWLFEVEKIE